MAISIDENSKSEESGAPFVKITSQTKDPQLCAYQSPAAQVTSFQIQFKTNSACTVTFQPKAASGRRHGGRAKQQQLSRLKLQKHSAQTFFSFFSVNCIQTKQQCQASLFFVLFEKWNKIKHNSDLLLWKLWNKAMLFNHQVHSKKRKKERKKTGAVRAVDGIIACAETLLPADCTVAADKRFHRLTRLEILRISETVWVFLSFCNDKLSLKFVNLWNF